MKLIRVKKKDGSSFQEVDKRIDKFLYDLKTLRSQINVIENLADNITPLEADKVVSKLESLNKEIDWFRSDYLKTTKKYKELKLQK